MNKPLDLRINRWLRIVLAVLVVVAVAELACTGLPWLAVATGVLGSLGWVGLWWAGRLLAEAYAELEKARRAVGGDSS